MHPIEHLLYYGCMLVPALFIPQTPFAVLYNRVHLDFSPLPGHDGYRLRGMQLSSKSNKLPPLVWPICDIYVRRSRYDQPGGGSHYHYLHHSKFNCNYGTPMMPMDKVLGYLLRSI